MSSPTQPYIPRRKAGNTSAESFGSVEFLGYIPDVTTTGTITIANGASTVLIVAAGALRGELIDLQGAFFDKGLNITLSNAIDVGCVLSRPR